MDTKHSIIRRALEQAPGTQLPENFSARLMERIRHESARREKRETWLLALSGIGCIAALIAGIGWYFFYEPGVGLQLPALPELPEFSDLPALPALPEFPDLSGFMKLPDIPASPAEENSLPLLYIFTAAVFLGLSGLDFCLRRRRRNKMFGNRPIH